MNLPDNSSDLEESQATQVLQGLLEPGFDSLSRRITRDDHSSISKDISDSSPPRNANSTIPLYHFHGLASTQTQTQHHDDDAQTEGGSQKENINADKSGGGEAPDVIDTRPSQASSSKPPRRRSPNDDQTKKPLSRVTKSKSTRGKAVSFQSPHTPKITTGNSIRTATSTTPTRFTPRNPPLPPTMSRTVIDQSSQDSFAGGVSQDPEQAFLAASKRFEIPLSELERDIDSTNDAMTNTLASGNRRYSSPSEGRILVAATPSNSGSSQSQSSQLLDESQSAFVNRYPEDTDAAIEGGDASQQSTQESQISSSYERYINGEIDEEPVHLPELQATQPSTQPDEGYREEDDEANSPWNAGGPISGESGMNDNATTSTVPHSRNLLSLVNPKNKWRYQQYQGRTPEPANVPSNDPGILPKATEEDSSLINNTNMQATQPSIDEEIAPPQRRFPGPAPRRPDLDTVMQETQVLPEDENAKLPQQQITGHLLYRRDEDPERLRPPPETGDERNTTQRLVNTLFPSDENNLIIETQPSLDDHNTVPPRRRFPKPRGYSNRPASGGMSDDPMDVVPDSEPLRDEPGDLARASQSPTKGSGKNVRRQINANPELNSISEEVVSNFPVSNEAKNDKLDVQSLTKSLRSGSEDAIQNSDDDDDDEDIPLAAAKPKLRSKFNLRNKGKSREVVELPITGGRPTKSRKLNANDTPVGKRNGQKKEKGLTEPEPDLREPSPQPPNDHEVSPIPFTKRPAIGRSWEVGVVPSSMPEQDLVDKGTSRTKSARKKGKEKGKGNGRMTSITSRPNIPARTLRPRQGKTPDNYAESSDEGFEDDPMSDILDGEDNITEPIDEEYGEPVAESLSLKRRRVGSSSTNPPMKPKAPAAATPSTQNKRLRSVSSSNRGAGSKPTRVFAEWNPDRNYYPGVIYAHAKGSSYTIKFDDNDKDTVDIEKIRAYELHVGDEVIYQQTGNRSSKIIHIDKLSDNIVSIQMNDGIKEVSVKKLKISHKAIKHSWDDRRISADSVIPVRKNLQSKTGPNSTPPKASFRSELSSGNVSRNLLSKTGIAVTTSAMGKSGIATKIRGNGGTVIDDWGTIILMEGKHTHSNNRWVIKKEEITLAKDVDLERVFLVADAPNQKAKFLIALALGIPCLSLRWLDDSVKLGNEQPWANYMLPQGFSETLNARPSQQVDVDWGTSVRHLREIMENAVPSKIFNDMSILCVGTELVPQPKGRTLPNTDGSMQDAHNAVVRIIMSMGARRVEAVSDLRYASAKPTSFDLVVIKEVPFCEDFNPENTVHWQWVKDSLIASRKIPNPVWEVPDGEEEFMQSQET